MMAFMNSAARGRPRVSEAPPRRSRRQVDSSLIELEYVAHVIYVLLATISERLAGFEISETLRHDITLTRLQIVNRSVCVSKSDAN